MLEMARSCVEVDKSVLGSQLSPLVYQTQTTCVQSILLFVHNEESKKTSEQNWYAPSFQPEKNRKKRE